MPIAPAQIFSREPGDVADFSGTSAAQLFNKGIGPLLESLESSSSAVGWESSANEFDSEGPGYDEETADELRTLNPLTMAKPTQPPEDPSKGASRANEGAFESWQWHPKAGDWKRHSGSRDPRDGLGLKGRLHKTWDLYKQGEEDAGYALSKDPKTGRYYSKPKQQYFSDPQQEGRPTPDFSNEHLAPAAPGSDETTPTDLTNFVKSFEGYSASAYGDYGQSSIGYGTRAKKGESRISRGEAEKRLQHELGTHKKRVIDHAAKFGYGFSPSQIDALTSFSFNTGRLAQLTDGGKRTHAEISKKIPEYRKAGGKVLKGLERRRAAEQKLFNK